MASLNVYKRHDRLSQTRFVLDGWDIIPRNEQRIEVESTNTNTDTTSIKVELLIIVDGNVGNGSFDTLNNSFFYECSDQWISVIRNRNLITLYVKDNFSTEERIGNISFHHNVDNIEYVDGKAIDNSINLSIIQKGHEYGVNAFIVNNGNNEEINDDIILESLPDEPEVKNFSVECIGGRNDFRLRKVKKYHTLKLQQSSDSPIVEIVRPVAYDNSFQVKYTFDENGKRNGFSLINFGNINCNYTERCIRPASIVYPREVKECHDSSSSTRDLIVSDYYYEVTINNIDCVDATDSFIVRYNTGEEKSIPLTPDKKFLLNAGTPYNETFSGNWELINDFVNRMFESYDNGDETTYMELMNSFMEMLETNLGETEVGNEEISITCAPSELIFDAQGGEMEAQINVTPENCLVYVKYYADFVENCYVDENKIKVALSSNPYEMNRDCVIYVFAMAQSTISTKVIVMQNGKPDTTR